MKSLSETERFLNKEIIPSVKFCSSNPKAKQGEKVFYCFHSIDKNNYPGYGISLKVYVKGVVVEEDWIDDLKCEIKFCPFCGFSYEKDLTQSE